MSITVDQIDLWRSLPSEAQRIEFKEAKNQFDYTKLCKYCVAIGNEGGGHLILGIEDIPPRIVVGTRAIGNPVAMAEKLLGTLRFRVDIEEIQHPSGRVVVVTIPSRPHGSAFHYEGAYLMRSGQALVPMPEDRLRTIFAEGKPDWLQEPSMYGLSPARVLELLDTKVFFELLDLPYPESTSGVMSRLIDEGLLNDEGGNSFTIRRIGALLLAKDIVKFQDVSRKAPRLVVYQGTSKTSTTIVDHTAVYGYAVGFQRLVGYVGRYLPQNEVIKDALRRSVKLIPDIAIRELVANALIHQDMMLHGCSVMIEIYNNRVEISNPGLPIGECP
jgi:predicted HTH transcriptional regulator